MVNNREYAIFQYLVKSNPNKYQIVEESFLEGMFVHYKLFDKEEQVFVGDELIHNRVKNDWHIAKPKEAETPQQNLTQEIVDALAASS